MSVEVGIRELRNHTSAILAALDKHEVVYLTNRGKRVAEIRPITDSGKSDLQMLMERADRMPKGETGHLDELLADKRASTSSPKDHGRWD